MKLFVNILLFALVFIGAPALAQDTASTGTLVVDVRPYVGEKPLSKKVEQQFKGAGLEWGIRDDLLVFTMVHKRFIDFPINHMTRYGQSETLTLPAGEYRITGIGMRMMSSFTMQKVLDRGAFVNNDVMTFRVEPGKTTTLRINSVIKRDTAFAADFWMPTLLASIVDKNGTSQEKALNERIDSSIGWLDYHGPLKFVAQ
ncbi:hypothetical protein V1318_10255 [Lysobacter sp. CCNWLW3]|uniref:hypothetical protein n=1 Tax=unclassified Lysobacter TaxID=2635362 RepID=UPI002FD7502B